MKLSLNKQIYYLSLAAICLISIIGATVYYFYALNWLGISLTLVFSGVGIWYFARLLFVKKRDSFGVTDIAENFIVGKNKIYWKKIAIAFAWFLPYLIFLFLISYFLFESRTDASLTSPWQVVSAKFFICYVLATGYLVWLILKNKRFTFWLIVAHYFLSFSVLWIVFKIGYGYDPFIHQATVKLINANGFVLPKTPYYLGQYSLILIAHKLFFIPIVWLDKLLVPLLAALTIPATIYLFFKQFFKNLAFSIQHLALLILLILPFSVFTLTVPQNLAYLFLLLSIFFALLAKDRTEIILSFLLAGAALVTHPVAGVPALLFALAIFIYHRSYPRAIKKIFYFAICLLTAVGLPWLFFLSTKNSAATAGGGSAPAGFALPSIIFPRQENIILNSVYFILGNEWLILIIFTLAAIYAIYRYRDKFFQFILLGGMALSLLAAYFITSRLNFSFLISYERNDYAQRILIDAFIFIVPILAVLIAKFIKLILNARPFVKYCWLAFLVILITISLYSAYPRLDNYYNSRSFTTGADDLAAVNWIAQDASATPYVVLADQQVSVGALWTFGFSHYYKSPLLSKEGSGGGSDDIYFYPIPTGGPLYQIYLNMVYQKPDRATALTAANLTGVNVVYFVINKYWTDFDKIVEQAKIDASSFQNIDNGQIYIFKYIR